MGGGPAPASGPVSTTERLRQLRELFKSHGSLDAYVVPTDDAHGSEYVTDADKRRAFISGFDGSAGTAVIEAEEARLFTDGRYFLQAGRQLDSNWTLMRRGEKDVPTWQEYLAKLPAKSRIGIDPTVIGIEDAKEIRKALEPLRSELVLSEENLIDTVWGKARPARPSNPLSVLPQRYAGKSAEEKVAEMRKEMERKKAKALVVSALDEVAWLLNLRGSDIDYNPVFFSFVFLTHEEVKLFVQKASLDEEVVNYLESVKIHVQPYEGFFDFLRGYASDLVKQDKVLVASNTSLAVGEALELDRVQPEPSIVAEAKSIKNQTEIEGFRACHIRDGAALCAYFAWLEEQLASGVKLTEYEGSRKLAEYRSRLDLFKGLSFTTISSTGPNAAIIHYSPDEVDSDIIQMDKIYLCDSGGQYLDGTTDVTRTLHFGQPSEDEVEAFTRVLKGHIAIDTLIFPKGTTGYQIDPMARSALWRVGMDYNHSTGHGVGSFLNVHEGPQSISGRIASSRVALKPGMTLSNEPGFYKDGSFGIRIESVVVVREVETEHDFMKKGWLGFERVTMTPIQTKLVDVKLLTPEEVDWLEGYNRETFEKVSPLLKGDQRALDWLKRECRPM